MAPGKEFKENEVTLKDLRDWKEGQPNLFSDGEAHAGPYVPRAEKCGSMRTTKEAKRGDARAEPRWKSGYRPSKKV